MDCNKDEALRCIDIATNAVAEGDQEKAIKFLLKAEKLHPTFEAKKLLEKLQSSPCSSKPSQNIPDAKKEDCGTTTNGSRNCGSEYTSEQLHLVQRIKNCKNYYEVLNVTKEATVSEIKKSYKKLALQLHPDKNKAPDASEAFKHVSKAMTTLTDLGKRRQYDLTYSNEKPNSSFQEHSFEANMTGEEFFHMFFHGSDFTFFGPNLFTRSNRWGCRTNRTQEDAEKMEPQFDYSTWKWKTGVARNKRSGRRFNRSRTNYGNMRNTKDSRNPNSDGFKPEEGKEKRQFDFKTWGWKKMKTPDCAG